jgi:hypothetical protein
MPIDNLIYIFPSYVIQSYNHIISWTITMDVVMDLDLLGHDFKQ